MPFTTCPKCQYTETTEGANPTTSQTNVMNTYKNGTKTAVFNDARDTIVIEKGDNAGTWVKVVPVVKKEETIRVPVTGETIPAPVVAPKAPILDTGLAALIPTVVPAGDEKTGIAVGASLKGLNS